MFPKVLYIFVISIKSHNSPYILLLYFYFYKISCPRCSSRHTTGFSCLYVTIIIYILIVIFSFFNIFISRPSIPSLTLPLIYPPLFSLCCVLRYSTNYCYALSIIVSIHFYVSLPVLAAALDNLPFNLPPSFLFLYYLLLTPFIIFPIHLQHLHNM